MKIGVSSYSYRNYMLETKCNFFKICDIAKEMGFDGIEFTTLEEKELEITTDPLATAKEIKAHCEKIGLPIIAYTVGANFLAADPEAEVARLKRDIDVAEALGAPLLRHDVCYGLPKKHLYSYRDAIKEIVPYILEVTKYAESKGIKTCSENHGYIFQSPERVEELILAVNHPNYGWLCDMGNFLCADADPAKSVAVAARYAFHVHTKDFLLKDGSQPKPDYFFGTTAGNYLRGTILGHGVVPIAKCVSILQKAGYDGYYSVEFEGCERNLEAVQSGLNFLRAL